MSNEIDVTINTISSEAWMMIGLESRPFSILLSTDSNRSARFKIQSNT